ncbi:hypothetical protein [Janthinobacterium sp. LB3P118]|uniref:hypothetical protein n=1 Tax=Janthinobacterium sp. LB3P118 TaxID=3424195 RepID=UPI003F29B9EB
MKNIGLFHFAQANMMPSLREVIPQYDSRMNHLPALLGINIYNAWENRRDTQQVCPGVLKEVSHV